MLSDIDFSKKNAFADWLIKMGRDGRRLPDSRACQLLGLSPVTVRAYRRGTALPPRHVALACSALVWGLPAWPAGNRIAA